jgi:hypothetical protein
MKVEPKLQQFHQSAYIQLAQCSKFEHALAERAASFSTQA